MKNKIGKRVHKLEENLAEHVKAYRDKEADAGTMLARIKKDSTRFVKGFFKAKPTKDRKKAIHYVKEGMKCFNKRDHREAILLFEKSIKADPGYTRAYAYLGDAHHKLKHTTKAVTAWQKAIDLDPKSDAAHHAKDRLRNVNIT